MYRQMRYYISVVETGSFFEAGEACHISQSAVSQQIKTLEEELQVQLLERHGRKFTVTPAGQYFYEQAKRQVSSLDSLIREVRRIGTGEYRRLRVGVLNGFSMQEAIAQLEFGPALRKLMSKQICNVSAGLLNSITGLDNRTISNMWNGKNLNTVNAVSAFLGIHLPYPVSLVMLELANIILPTDKGSKDNIHYHMLLSLRWASDYEDVVLDLKDQNLQYLIKNNSDS